MARTIVNLATGEVTYAEDIPPYVPTPEEAAAAQLAADTADLTPAQFEWLLAYTGLEDVFTGLTASSKAPQNATYAALKADRRRLIYKLDLTLAKVAAFGPQIAAQYPSVDVSETAIRNAWKLATQFE